MSNFLLRIARYIFSFAEICYDMNEYARYSMYACIFRGKVPYLAIYEKGNLEEIFNYDTFSRLPLAPFVYNSLYDIQKLAHDYKYKSYIARYYQRGKCITDVFTPNHRDKPPKVLPYIHVLLNEEVDITKECTELWNFIHDDVPITVRGLMAVLQAYYHRKRWVIDDNTFIKVMHSDTFAEQVFKANDYVILL